MHDVYINSLGAFLPGPPIPNSEMEDYLGRVNGVASRNRALVLRQNKIRTRHYSVDKNGKAQYSNAQMAGQAIRHAIDASEAGLNDISYLATSTTISDLMLPGLASHVHAELGIAPMEVASFQSVCASAMMALKSAYLQIKAGEHICAAVSGSEIASRYFQPGFYENVEKYKAEKTLPFEADFLRFTLSDGAGAAILENRPNARQLSLKIHWIDIRSFANQFDTCMIGGGIQEDGVTTHWGEFANPVEAVRAGAMVLTQNFPLMKQMFPIWVSHYLDMIDKGKIHLEEIDHVCSHYSSHSLREEMIVLLKAAGAMIDEEKWFSNLPTKGNTGTASIFILLEELYQSGRLKAGEKILCHVPESGRCLNGLMLLEVVG